MKNRAGNCQHGLSLDLRNPDCCLVCSSPKIGLTEENDETRRALAARSVVTTKTQGSITLRYAPKHPN